MAWLVPRAINESANATFQAFLNDLEAKLSDPSVDRNELCRNLLAEFLYGTTYSDLEARLPVVALGLDPRNITLEAEYYGVLDQERFALVKPLLWLWYNADLAPLMQSVRFGVAFRAVLAKFVFKRLGKNFKCFPGVQFSVGYNLEVGDDVVIHRQVLVDDIGGVTLHDRASLSDFVNVYSHTHSALQSADVTLKHTTIGVGVRVTYHATVLAGATLSDDAMVGTLSVVTKDVAPHVVAFGIPAQARAVKLREITAPETVDSRVQMRRPDRKANSDYPEPTQKTTRPATDADVMPSVKSKSLQP